MANEPDHSLTRTTYSQIGIAQSVQICQANPKRNAILFVQNSNQTVMCPNGPIPGDPVGLGTPIGLVSPITQVVFLSRDIHHGLVTAGWWAYNPATIDIICVMESFDP